MLTEEQIKLRKDKIGGSDSAVILGANPFVTLEELLAEKIGLTSSFTTTAAMERGAYLEPVAAEMYSRKTGRKLKKINRTLYYKEDPLFVAHVDRRIESEPTRPPAVLEIKCPGINQFYKMKKYGIPTYVTVQAQHYMMVGGWVWAAVSIFNSDLWESINIDVERDEEIIDLIKVKGREFWEFVEEGRIANYLPQRATDRFERFKSQEVEIPKIFKGEMTIVKGDEWGEAIKDLRNAQELMKAASLIEDKAKENIKSLMTASSASSVCTVDDSVRIYFKEQEGKRSFDLKGFKSAHPELLDKIAKFEKQGSPFKTLRAFYMKQNLLEQY